jgi:hypothetical protein
MEVGVHFFDQTLSGSPRALRSHLRDTADAAEEAGCTMFTCMDQYFQMEAFTRAEDPMLRDTHRRIRPRDDPVRSARVRARPTRPAQPRTRQLVKQTKIASRLADL